MAKIDRDAVERVAESLAKGNELTYEDIGNVFGSSFWMMLVESLMDSQDAARAIQGAVNRLRSHGIDVDDADDYLDEEEDEIDG